MRMPVKVFVRPRQYLRRARIIRSSLGASLAFTLLIATPVWAQDTGAISGVVTDPDGTALPGVSVTMDSTMVPSSTVYTQTNGVYRYPVLPPDEQYTLTFMLEGFKTIIQEAVPVRVGGNTQINVGMELSTVEETVTVTGTTPIVDVKKTGTGQNMTEQYMQSIPSARDPWVMMQQTAGMQVDRENIGGSESGQQSSFGANGSNRSDAMWTYDGAEITDMSALGASPMYYDFDAFEEISISTGGNDPSIQTGGTRINFVTKRGGNDWRGATRFYLTDGNLQSRNVGDPDTGELTGNFSESELYPGYIGNSIQNIKDWGGEVGGPVVADKAFVWVSYGKQDIKQAVGTSPDNTQLKNWHAKANFHLGDKAVLNYTFVHADKTKQGRGAAANRPPETTFIQGGPTPIHTGKLQYTINDNNYVEASYNDTGLGFFLNAQGGTEAQVQYDLATGMWGQSYFSYSTVRPLKNGRLDGNSYVAGSSVDHEFKYGYSFRTAKTSSVWGPGGGAVAVFIGGAPAEAWLIADEIFNYQGSRQSVYLGDTVSAGRLTMNLGLRYDKQDSQANASQSPDHPLNPALFPALTFDGFKPDFGWNSLSPRLGLTYDLSGNGTTILRFSAARYYSQQYNGEFNAPITTFGPEVDFQWNDANGNGNIDTGEAFGDPLWVSGGFDVNNPNAPKSVIMDATSAPWSNELIMGAEHELSRSLAIGADFVYRKNGNETWEHRLGEDDPAFWEQVTQNVSGYGSLQVYQPYGSRSGTTTYRNRPNYTSSYSGITAYLNKRFANNWMGNASFTWANPKQRFGSGGYTDPTNIESLNAGTYANDGTPRGGTSAGAARWFAKFGGMYQLPQGISLAGFFRLREGHVIDRYVRSNNRANGAGRVNANLAPFGSERLSSFWNLDLRAEKTFDLQGSGRIHFIMDAFNITNNDHILAVQRQFNSSAYSTIRDVVQGRTIRFGARLVLR